MDRGDANEYTCTGSESVAIDVAHAAAFGNPGGRLAVYNDSGVDVTLMLDRANWTRLRDNIDALLAELDRRGV